MKIFVNNIPHKPEECLFAVKNLTHKVYSESDKEWVKIEHYSCNVNGKLCDLSCGKNCNKLRCIF